jgi:thiamine-phosphate pyrophosphorylase
MASGCLLYYITDRSQFRGGDLERRKLLIAKVGEAARAQVDYIQLREKDLNAHDLEALAREVVSEVREHSASTRVLINSRTDVALAAGADGVHLRGDDIPPDDVRRVLRISNHHAKTSGHFLVAASCHSAADVMRAASEAVDFVVIAPVFEKSSVPAAQALGIATLREACKAGIPVLALGGVTLENATSCLSAGAAGVAGIRLFQENKIEDVVRALRTK